MLSFLQGSEPAVSHTVIEAAAGIVLLTVNQFMNHRKGKRRDESAGESRSVLTRIETKVDTVAVQVRDLSAHVIGPDGQNGLRGDVRELKEDVKGIKEREYDRLHGPYDRRTP